MGVQPADFGNEMKIDDPFFENWQPAALTNYSKHLIQVVRDCLQDQPGDRLTAAALLALITGPVPDVDMNGDVSEEDQAVAERAKADRDGIDVDEQWPDFVAPKDSYRIGLSIVDVLASVLAATEQAANEGEVAEDDDEEPELNEDDVAGEEMQE